MTNSEDSPKEIPQSRKFGKVKEFIEGLRSEGVEPDSVVVPDSDWDEIKEHAKTTTDESGFPATYIDGVRILHAGRYSKPQARVTFTGEYDG